MLCILFVLSSYYRSELTTEGSTMCKYCTCLPQAFWSINDVVVAMIIVVPLCTFILGFQKTSNHKLYKYANIMPICTTTTLNLLSVYFWKTLHDRIAFFETTSCVTLLTNQVHPVLHLFRGFGIVLQR